MTEEEFARAVWVKETEQAAATARQAFKQLQKVCHHRSWDRTDCEHPDIEFKCMGCQVSVCPLMDEE